MIQSDFMLSPQDEFRQLQSRSESRAAAKFVGNTTYKKLNGVYYTDNNLAQKLVSLAVQKSKTKIKTFLEPCVGGGAFVFAFLNEAMRHQEVTKSTLSRTLNKCFVADNDAAALENFQSLVPIYLRQKFNIELDFPESNVFFGDSLFIESETETKVRNLHRHFGVDEGFDLIATNPPYLQIKPDARQGEPALLVIKKIQDRISASQGFELLQGVPNLYKMFVEAITTRWIGTAGSISLLVPSSLLRDKQSEALRMHLLHNFNVHSVLELSEGNAFFKDVGQSFVGLSANKGQPTKKISFFQPDLSGGISKSRIVDVEVLRKATRSNSVFGVTDQELYILEGLKNSRRINEIFEIANLRGELDITLDARIMDNSGNGLPVVYGKNISKFTLSESGKFAKEEILDRPKGRFAKKARIACQQIANANSQHRLKWALVAPNTVLANSCNFLSIDTDTIKTSPEVDLYFLLGVLNSDLLNTFFKILSSNNHISNYEIGLLPIPTTSSKKQALIADLAKSLVTNFDTKKLNELNKEVNLAFELPGDWGANDAKWAR